MLGATDIKTNRLTPAIGEAGHLGLVSDTSRSQRTRAICHSSDTLFAAVPGSS